MTEPEDFDDLGTGYVPGRDFGRRRDAYRKALDEKSRREAEARKAAEADPWWFGVVQFVFPIVGLALLFLLIQSCGIDPDCFNFRTNWC